MAFDKNNLKIDQNLVYLYIVYGLPGSGKTTFLYKTFDFFKPDRDFQFFNMDFFVKSGRTDLKAFFKERFSPRYMGYGQEYTFVVDGLFLTPKDVTEFVDKMAEFYDRCYFAVQLYIWKENREACLNNDEQRLEDGTRDVPSADTIKNAVYVVPQEKDLVSNNPRVEYLKPEFKDVHYANNYEKFFNRYNVNNDEMRSEEWRVGGSERSFYRDERSVDAEEAKDFDNLDKFLETMCPDISFLLYKKIKRECVTLEKRESYDYYSSYTYNYWRCDLKKLYQILTENNLL